MKENEYAVLSGIKIDNKVYDDIGLKPEDFFTPGYAEIYRVMGQIIESGYEANDMTIIEELQKRKSKILPSVIIGLEYPTTANIEYHVKEVKEYSNRQKIKKLIPMIQDGLNGGKPTGAVLEDVEQAITEIFGSAVHELQWLKDLIYPTICEIEKLYNLKGGYTGVRSGFNRLDELTNGFQAGELIVIGARPSVGKTAFAMSMAVNMCTKFDTAVGFFSCEMSIKQLGLRIISGKGRINLSHVKNGMIRPDDFNRITAVAGELQEAPMAIDDTPNIHLTELKSRSRKMKRLGVQIIFVDYLTLIKHDNTNLPRNEQVGDISKNLKQLARELDIPIIALSQVVRGAEGKMPTLADLRWSGEIEEDSDVIMFLHRKDGENETKLRVAKQRNGATDTVELYFTPQYVRFEDVSYEKR